MSIANYEYVDPAINVYLVKGLLPFVEQRIGSRNELEEAVRECVSWQWDKPLVTLDAQALLHVVERRWRDYFHGSFPLRPRAMRSYVNELWDARDRCAHRAPPNYFSNTEAERVLGTVVLLLTAIEAHQEAIEVARLKQEYMRARGVNHEERTGNQGTRPVSEHAAGTLPLPPKATASVAPGVWLLRGYTQPDGSIRAFVDHSEESSYLQWVESHQDGFVVNAPKPSMGGEMKLHRPRCGYVKGAEKRLVGEFYFKACSESKEELVDWMDRQMKDWNQCRTCKP